MLTALNENGDLISLSDNPEEKQMISQCQNKTFYCPQCKEQLIIKAGEIRMIHFSHKKNSKCISSFSEPESDQHLKGKKQLHHFFLLKGLETHLEYYLKELQQRPDILVKYNTQRYAIEFQCSTISRKVLSSRTNGYISKGITPVWILGGLPYHKKNGSVYELSDFHFTLASTRKGIGLSLFSYNPQKKMVYMLVGIIPLTTRKVFATLYSLPLNKLTLPFPIKLKPKPLSHLHWLKEKNQWIANKVRFGSLISDPFLKEVYTAQENPFLLPAICGIPIEFMEHFLSHPCEWQFFIYQDCIKKLKAGQIISLKYVYQKMRNRINRGDVLIRKFPLDITNNCNWEAAIAQFFLYLTELEYFYQIGEDIFKLRKQLYRPKTNEEAVELEKEMYRRLASSKT
ncbi:competence protein CoiA [Bacillus sp. FSL K6-3431]|uniref:competence protein CoiA n=1 Tax=Bacillus sp. FSL K6-3431 TaxID=2921500 RepID=UPI0030F9AF1C